MLPTRWFETKIRMKKLPKQCIFTTLSGHPWFHLRFPQMYLRICSKFQPRNFPLFHGVRVASTARMLIHDAHARKKMDKIPKKKQLLSFVGVEPLCKTFSCKGEM
jgi:hypothetical protein